MKVYNVITLCGSTKFKEEFLKVQKALTLQGNIDMANEIYVINKGGYIGSSTKSEIKYAKSRGKGIKYLEA